MRVLVVSNGEFGHLLPMVPLVRAIIAAGHDACVAVPSDFVETVAALGLPVRGLATQALDDETKQQWRRRVEGLPPSERPRNAVREFLEQAERGLVELDAVADAFAPDVVLRELMAFGGWLLGARRRLPVATFDFFPLPRAAWRAFAGGLFDAAAARWGLPPDPQLEAFAHATLVAAPRSWFDTLEPTVRLFQPSDAVVTPANAVAPAWLDGLEPPIVYATLGTTFNKEPGLWPLLFEALGRVDARVVATVGGDVDRATLPAASANVRVEGFVPQQLVLARCSAAVTHGGYGSLMGALARGIPIVSIPIAASDNVRNAVRLADLGAGVAILPDERAPDRIAAAVGTVLHGGSHRAAAARLAQEIATLPPIEAAVPVLEKLAAR